MEQKRNAMMSKLARAQALLKSGSVAGYRPQSLTITDKKPMSWGPMMRK